MPSLWRILKSVFARQQTIDMGCAAKIADQEADPADSYVPARPVPECETHIWTEVAFDFAESEGYAVCGVCGYRDHSMSFIELRNIRDRLMEAERQADQSIHGEVVRQADQQRQASVSAVSSALASAFASASQSAQSASASTVSFRDALMSAPLRPLDIRENELRVLSQRIEDDMIDAMMAPARVQRNPRVRTHAAEEIERLNEEAERNRNRVQPGAPLPKKRRKLTLKDDNLS